MNLSLRLFFAAIHEATLSLRGANAVPVPDVQALHDALRALPSFSTGEAALLARGPKHYIKATRRDGYWSVSTRCGRIFTLASFTAEMTTDYSAREVQLSREAGTLWNRMKRRWSAPPPERALSTGQVETLFTEYLLGKRFSLPQSGA